MLESAKIKIIFEEFQRVYATTRVISHHSSQIHNPPTSQTDGRTDGQITYYGITTTT